MAKKQPTSQPGTSWGQKLRDHPGAIILGLVVGMLGLGIAACGLEYHLLKSQHETRLDNLRREYDTRFLEMEKANLRHELAPAAAKKPSGLNELAVYGGKIRGLYLGGSGLTDAGLEELTCLKDVEDLELQSCFYITDQEIAHLTKLARLRELDVQNTRISPRAIAELQQKMPQLKLIRK